MKPANFIVQELVDPATYKARGDASWQLLDKDALTTLQQLRDQFGPITVNNWHSGGSFKESGLRDPLTSTGAKYSQHKFGRAFDCKFKDTRPQEVYAHILANRSKFPLLTTLEDVSFTPSWLHFDTRFTGQSSILVVKP